MQQKRTLLHRLAGFFRTGDATDHDGGSRWSLRTQRSAPQDQAPRIR